MNPMGNATATKPAPTKPEVRTFRLEDARGVMQFDEQGNPTARYVIGRRTVGKVGEFSGLTAFRLADGYEPDVNKITGTANVIVNNHGAATGIEITATL